MSALGRRAKLYISYSRRNTDQLHRLLEYLSAHESLIEILYDGLLKSGDVWDVVLRRWLEEAEVVVFLVSRDSLESPYVRKEMMRATSRIDDLRILPVILEPCEFTSSPLAPIHAEVLYAAPDPDDGWRQVTAAIRRLVEQVLAEETPSVPPGRARLEVAYRAALANPAAFELLETLDATALAAVAPTVARSDAAPPALWTAWMLTVHPQKLGEK
jgi:hypothetical protein